MSVSVLHRPIQRQRTSKIPREINAIITIAARDILLAIKSPSQLIVYLVLPMIMMGMLGGSLAQNMAGGLGFDYGQFILVGMLVNMVMMSTVMNLSSLVEDHQTDFTQEMLVSPVSRYSIVIGKILGSSFGALFSMIGTMIVGMFMGYTLSFVQWLFVFALAPLMCLSAGALAMLVLGGIKSNRVANIAVMAVTMPQMFLSGALIPIDQSSGILLVLNRIMPMTYCLDLMRSVVYAGTPDYDSVVLFNPVVNCIAIVVITVVCLFIGTWLFARSEKNQ